MAEQLFASFILDREQGLEIAIAADSVTEATAITERIQPLPASVSFLEGIMHLRDKVIPILNMKKRMGISDSSEYGTDAKIAVVTLSGQPFGLLFDDIQEVIRVDESLLMPIQPALQSKDYVISDLITLKEGRRILEVLDLERLFNGDEILVDHDVVKKSTTQESESRSYSRYVIFLSGGTEYGIPVENSRELTFLSDIDDTFKTGHLEGALQLRGHTIPVLNAGTLLHETPQEEKLQESSRILVMATDALNFGMIIDDIKEILTVCNEEILPTHKGQDNAVTGVYEPETGRNIILLDIANLVSSQMKLLESMARMRTDNEEKLEARTAESRHLITENCYLIFSIGKKFAIELKDVQEIIEHNDLLSLPGARGFDSKIINLRGQIIPVVNLRTFYNYSDKQCIDANSRLIICQNRGQLVALQVDNIITIFKQEEFHETPSLNPQLSERQDTLDRLIEFIGEQGLVEHVLVVNTENLINNHLQKKQPDNIPTEYSDMTEEANPLPETEERR
jgi:purine-binding chemotaxis protein CheW